MVCFNPTLGDIDDRVRAIASALGYRSVLWTFDSTDTGATPTTTAPAEIAKWLTAQAGFITLQHDISAVTTKIAIDALKLLKAPALQTKPQPVAQCLGIAQAQWYKSGSSGSGTIGTNTATATTSATTATSAAGNGTSPNIQGKSSGATSGTSFAALWWTAISFIVAMLI